MKDMQQWETEMGIKFLRRIGIRKGDTVVDFGERVGHYTIPAATIVGSSGKVYAVDKNVTALNELSEKIYESIIDQVTMVHTTGEMHLNLPDTSATVCLFYDVLHMLPNSSRRFLYNEVRRVLMHAGIMSVYPRPACYRP